MSVSAPPPAADGSFSLTSLLPGAFRLTATPPGQRPDGSSPWALKSVMVNGRENADAPIEIKPNTNLTDVVITFTDRVSEISGTLMDAAGRPSPNFAIIVFPADRALWTSGSRRAKAARPASDGTYKILGLPAGNYLLVAVTDFEASDLSDAIYLTQLAAVASPIALADGEKKTQNLKLAGKHP
jgi:hypothetical protein